LSGLQAAFVAGAAARKTAPGPLPGESGHHASSSLRAAAKRQPATFHALARDLFHQEQALVLDAVSVVQHPMCSFSGTAFATPHSTIFGSMSDELGWRIERFFYKRI
jgi:hypothetical protein